MFCVVYCLRALNSGTKWILCTIGDLRGTCIYSKFVLAVDGNYKYIFFYLRRTGGFWICIILSHFLSATFMSYLWFQWFINAWKSSQCVIVQVKFSRRHWTSSRQDGPKVFVTLHSNAIDENYGLSPESQTTSKYACSHFAFYVYLLFAC